MAQPITSFEQLEVHQLSCVLDLAIFNISKQSPKEEMYSLTESVPSGQVR